MTKKYVPAVIVWDEYGESIDYIVPKKLKDKFYEEQNKLDDLSRDYFGCDDEDKEQVDKLREQWYRESKQFEKQWAKYKQEKITLYIVEE